MKSPTFITGNQHKADYFARLMDLPIAHQAVQLTEPQSLDLHEIVTHKLHEAYAVVGGPVIVEDVSLEFTALRGLPGPFIKFFVEASGVEACCRMLDGFQDRGATIRCTFGYYDGSRLELFDSAQPGVIAEQPRGQNGYGFDQIFMHVDSPLTRAEMSSADNEATYRDLMKPFAKVREFLQKLEASSTDPA